MYVIVSNINPQEGSVELVVISGDRVLLGFWVPAKFPDRCRIEKVVKGRPIDRAQFLELCLILATALTTVIKGKKPSEITYLIGRSFEVDFELEFKALIKE